MMTIEQLDTVLRISSFGDMLELNRKKESSRLWKSRMYFCNIYSARNVCPITTLANRTLRPCDAGYM